MKTLEEIKDDVAQENGYTCYKSYAYTDEGKTPSHQDDYDFHLNMLDEAARRYAKQCCEQTRHGCLNRIVSTQRAEGCADCTYGDTDFDSLSVCHGYNNALDDCASLVSKTEIKLP